MCSECTQAQLANGEFESAAVVSAERRRSGWSVFAHRAGQMLGPIPVYNMVPPPNVPARFAFNVLGSIVVLDAHVRTGGDYGLGVTASDVPQGTGDRRQHGDDVGRARGSEP